MVTRYGKKTSTTVRRSHLSESHPSAWIAACDKLGIDITAKGAQNTVRNYRKQHNPASSAAASDPEDLRKPFTPEAFVDAIVDFIVSDDQVLVKSSSVFISLIYTSCDQSINVIESPKLRAIFLMLREDLKDSDIPHRTTIRNRIMEIWDEHLDMLQDQMKVNFI
jgi:hypothetical protein